MCRNDKKKAGSGWACFFVMALSFLLHVLQILWTMTKIVFICHRHFEGLVRVVTHAPFYYVFTTNDCLNMPRFAPICPFCNIQTKICSFSKTRIMRHTTAYCGISGRRNPMTKILFVCHGNISYCPLPVSSMFLVMASHFRIVCEIADHTTSTFPVV